MGILPIFPSGNSGGNLTVVVGSESNNLSFKNYLSQKNLRSATTTNNVDISFPKKISLKEIVADLSGIFNKESIDLFEPIQQLFEENSGIGDELSSTLYLVKNEVNDVLAENPSLNDLFEKIKEELSIIPILSLTKAVENMKIENQLELTPIISSLDSFLGQEFSSYKNKENPSFKTMLKSVDQMSSNDQARLEGQILLRRILNDRSVENLSVIDKILTNSNSITDENIGLYSNDLIVKESILNDLKSISTFLSRENESIKNLFTDEQTLTNVIEAVGMVIPDNNTFEDISTKINGLSKNVHPIISSLLLLGNELEAYKSILSEYKTKENASQIDESLNSRDFPIIVSRLSVNSRSGIDQILREKVQKINQPIGNRHQKEDTFVIQLDKPLSNQAETQVGSKTDASNRQEFTNQLLNVLKNSKFGQMPNGANRLILKLNPEYFGSITVKLIQKNGEMIARLITSTESAKDLLDHSIHQLKQALPSVQIEVERFEVQTEQLPKTVKDHSDKREENRKDHEQQHEEEQNSDQSFVNTLKAALNTTV